MAKKKTITVESVNEALRDSYLDLVEVEEGRVDPPARGFHRVRHLSAPEAAEVDQLKGKLEQGMVVEDEIEILRALHTIFERKLTGGHRLGLAHGDMLRRERCLAVVDTLEALLGKEK